MSCRLVVRISGESGSGVDSAGHIIMHALKKSGYYVVADREYPSLIKGGCANYQINISNTQIYGQSIHNHIGIGTTRSGVLDCIEHIQEGGIILSGYEKIQHTDPLVLDHAKSKDLQIIHIPALQIAQKYGGNIGFTNTVMIATLWGMLGASYDILVRELTHKFGKKKTLLDTNLACLAEGYEMIQSYTHQTQAYRLQVYFGGHEVSVLDEKLLIEGNTALALGAIHGGVRAYYAYPMSPSSSILTYLAKVATQTGMLVKQIEDEIAVVNMALGSMYAGTRALCATSAGGFDLMIETISLSAMTEVPLVIVIAQRPGPATGLPTWTAQADLNLAIYAGHGEFTKCVIAISDPQSAFSLIQQAFNIAEQYHIPVIVLTEKTIAESYQVVDQFKQYQITIERGLVQDEIMLSNLKAEHRFALTDSGISFRRIPGSSQTISYTNGDEHHTDGTLDESPEISKMVDKRIRKIQSLSEQIPEPLLIGNPDAKITLVGRGSSLNPIQDALVILEEMGIKVNYLHYHYIVPLKLDILKHLIHRGNKIIIIEGNASAQLGLRISQHTGYFFSDQWLKYNGRPWYVEEIVEKCKNIDLNQTPSVS